MKKIIIIGAGDGGRLISQIIKEDARFEVAGFIDDDNSLRGEVVNGYRVIGKSSDLNKFKRTGFVVSIGADIKARARLFRKAVDSLLEPVSIIHRTAVVGETASIGKGTIILANCVINPFVKVGLNVFIFTQTVLEHDTVVGDNVYFSPGVKLAGNVKVGNNTFFGINSCVIEGVRIGKNVIIGAGSVVLKDVADNIVAAGVPAKKIRENR